MRVKIDGVDYLYHHVVFCLCHERWPVEVDHIDRNKLHAIGDFLNEDREPERHIILPEKAEGLK